MSDFFGIPVNSSWTSKEYVLPAGPLTALVRRFPSLEEANRLVDGSYVQVYGGNGAIFIGESPPIIPVSAQEMIRRAEMGLPPPEMEPFYLEVVAIKQVRFVHLLGFLDAFNYASEAGDSAAKIREEAKQLLRWVNDLETIGLTSMNFASLSANFLQPVAPHTFDEVFEKVMEFNRKHFAMELSREVWRRTFRQANGFSLGPS